MGRIALLVMLLTAGPAMAQADCHIGLMAGHVVGRSQHVPDGSEPLNDTFDVEGRGLGAKLGCLASRGGWRYGFGADLMDSKAKGDAQMHAPNQNFFGETYFEWFGTARAVGGYEFPSGWSTYLTGGLAVASIRLRICQVTPTFCATETQTFWGLTGGAGVQYRFLRRMSASLEYLYFGFEDKPFRRSGALVIGDNDISVNPEAHMVRLGLNVHF
jgi:opacity protein-like surface antigen